MPQQQTPVSTTPVPRWRLPRIDRLTKDLSRALSPFVGAVVDYACLEYLVAGCSATLGSDAWRPVLFESLRYLTGLPQLTSAEVGTVARRLAGNAGYGRAPDRAILPWRGFAQDEWLALQVMRCWPVLDYRHERAYLYRMYVLAGTAAGMLVEKTLSPAAARVVARRCGFSRPRGKYPYRHGADLVGLRVAGLADAAKSHERVVIGEFFGPSRLVTWNREHVLRRRLRVGGERCPERFLHRCSQCAIGYDRCAAGTHAMTYEIGNCSECGEADAVFDPEDRSGVCVGCAMRRSLTRPGNR